VNRAPADFKKQPSQNCSNIMLNERAPLLSRSHSPRQRVQDAIVRYETTKESLDDRLHYGRVSFELVCALFA
jgi:hypothetical protein